MSTITPTTYRRPSGRPRRLPNQWGEWLCRRCDQYLSASEFIVNRQTGKPHSYCRACDSRRVAESRAGIRTRPRRKEPRDAQLPMFREVRGVIEAGHDDRCIVWETGLEGFCEVVTAAHCPCQVFKQAGTCKHHEKALELLSGPHSDRSKA